MVLTNQVKSRVASATRERRAPAHRRGPFLAKRTTTTSRSNPGRLGGPAARLNRVGHTLTWCRPDVGRSLSRRKPRPATPQVPGASKLRHAELHHPRSSERGCETRARRRVRTVLTPRGDPHRRAWPDLADLSIGAIGTPCPVPSGTREASLRRGRS